ncbi:MULTISPECIES: GMC family oxidoreductase [unclassified Streptomyces]|uniref:GMC family oxidoreductase n=1 Tax=unclassified Streptomyces TaxID=2593676 RepID=UPI002257C7A3|nr:GMC family oxidoreductase N-terminal domain-containing protein [Streptomyces sp. NBC_00183]MCX5288627.1 GMC family oxidoreductase N-terminal domain-containing protein [Streptomyces sp. NBC_00183]
MNEAYDYVVVGAGAAGAPLAARLSEDPDTTVLVLEAGPADDLPSIAVPALFPGLFGSAVDWADETAPQQRLAGRRVYWPHGRTLGGSSSINAMMWVPGQRADYDRWGELAGPLWSYAAVRPVLSRIGCDDGAPMRVAALPDPAPVTSAFLDACGKAGIPLAADENGSASDGARPTMVMQAGGRRRSTADGYLRPAAHRPNLVVRHGAAVHKVEIVDGRAEGVRYSVDGRPVTVTARREVILCAGAVDSPRLLMLSGIGPADRLRDHGIELVADAPEVGRNLRDHLAAMLLVEAAEPGPDPRRAPGAFTQFRANGRGPLTSNLGEAYAFVRSDPALPHPDIELVLLTGQFVDEGRTRSQSAGFTLAVVLLQPRSRGEIALRDADPLSRPLIDPGYLSDPEDRRVLDAGLRIAEEVLATEPLASEAGAPVQPALPPGPDRRHAAVQAAQSLYHPTGTCRMGTDPASVVDERLRVRGVRGLRVADASVMPEIVRGHTAAPSMLIGERAAELIAAERKG